MHVREVGAAAGVSVALVKFYVREGLLHPGLRESVNSTTYDESHVTRLRIIRALVDGGRLSLAAVRELLDVIDDPHLPVDVVVRDAQRAVARVEQRPSDRAVAIVQKAIAAHGWQVGPDNPGILTCASVVDTALAVGRGDMREMLDVYAKPIERIAHEDLAAVGRASETRTRIAETVVIGSVLGDAMLLGLRRIAQEHVSRSEMPAETRAGDVTPIPSATSQQTASGPGLQAAADS